ncbi:iron complex outermembrane receptor protein [Nitrospina gracilis]|uniref:TonB-dependent receptor family protein n=1 Tax=Nitrospina TaxID=35800 RepID=UPI00034DEA46|nr:TonB-dependent receptor [Nitrospina gracilis]MCF8724708.1 iron complex outermembrane receptor protein [Nitrospina sp. Nb-3]
MAVNLSLPSTSLIVLGTGFVITAMLCLASLGWGQEVPEESSEMVVLQPIEVTATRTKKSPDDIPNSLRLIDRGAWQNHQPGATLEEFGVGAPGVFFQNRFNFAQDLRIAIRGFGARSPFGVRGIQVRVDGIPQTLPDGQTQLDSIDTSLIQRMEVLRGPSASLFGNASGGMISMTTREPQSNGLELAPRQVFGSFGYSKTEMWAGRREADFDYGVFASRLGQTGWRRHSRMENLFAQLKVNLYGGSDSDWMVLFRKFYSPLTEDPGGLTLQQAEANPRQGAPRNLLFNAGEEVDQEQLAVRYRKLPTAQDEWTVTAHLLRRDFENRLPFTSGGRVRFDRWVGGLAVQWQNDRKVADRANRFLAGIDYGIQNDDRQRFDNNNGRQGALTFDQVERVQSVGPFFRNEWKMSEKWDIVVGGRWDWLHYRVDDKFGGDGDQSGSQTLSQGSGTAGVVYHLADRHQVYANVASVFEAPTTTELINNPSGAGGFNPNLQSQTSLSQELGLRGKPADWEYEVAVFYIRSWDEITPFELPAFPGRTFFRNAGKSRRLGLETRLATPMWHGLQAEAAYTYSDFEFEEFVANNVSLEGKTFPGVPVHHWEGRVSYTHPSGTFGQVRVQRVGRVFADNANTSSNAGYSLGQLLLGWEGKWECIEASLFAGVNNLFDDRYNANVRINAAFGRFFEPGPPINVFGGLRLRILPF